MQDIKISTAPKDIFGEYKSGTEYKDGIGTHGISKQGKVNERFYVGDHWHGVEFGDEMPLVRRNLTKRTGDYKIAHITSSPIAVNYTADGIPVMTEDTEERKNLRESMSNGNIPEDDYANDDEISIVMEALSQYFNVTAERVKFNQVKWQAVHDAYITGTTVIWNYWDEFINTGLYVDSAKKVPIKGDLAVEVLSVDQVVFGDPNDCNVQRQPYIIIAQRLTLDRVKREAKQYGVSEDDIQMIKPDGVDQYTIDSSDRGSVEPENAKRVTVLTKLYKEWDDNGDYRVMCTRVCEKVVIREPWDMKITLYPLAVMSWEPRRGCIYGDSEITYMIPNQIAVNRALSAEVWATMSSGMPVTIVNGDIVTEPYNNTPGKVIKVYGGVDEVAGAVHVVQPAAFVGQLINGINDLASNTLSDNGANDAALGNIRPDNASAIIQLREASSAPLQVYMNRFYDMVEDLARIWADFWLHLYGDRKLKISDRKGVHYFPFNAERYKKLVINAKIDVGASTVYSEAVVITTLDNLLLNGQITFEQYLENLPAGIIPNATKLLADVRDKNKVTSQAEREGAELNDEMMLEQWAAENPEQYRAFTKLSAEEQAAMLTEMRGAMKKAGQDTSEQEVPI